MLSVYLDRHLSHISCSQFPNGTIGFNKGQNGSPQHGQVISDESSINKFG